MATNEENREGTDDLARREEEAAAAEAAAIGGEAPDYDTDEAHRPLQEAGEGEAEGFEDAENELIEAASHGEHRHSPADDEFPPEEESDAAYGEPDEVDPTEVVRDPEAETDDDPGEGPGIAAER